MRRLGLNSGIKSNSYLRAIPGFGASYGCSFPRSAVPSLWVL